MISKPKATTHSFKTKLLSGLLSATMLGSAFIATGSAAVSMGTIPAGAATVITEDCDFDLMGTTQEGVILHAWDWSFNNIKDNMENIAKAGYTSIQTSPIQQAKEATAGHTNSDWWVYYQPADFVIDDTGTSALGTKAEFQAMCEEAHKYGIHIIVDVVANHLGNGGSAGTKAATIPPEIRDNDSYWHTYWNVSMNNNPTREGKINYSMTSDGSLPDLNTEYEPLQGRVLAFLEECIDAGADGFRFDAAKHIGTASDGSQYTFWDNIIPAAKKYYQSYGNFSSLYCYGEILGDTGASDNAGTINSYISNIKLTEDTTGNTIRSALNSNNAAGTKVTSYTKGVSGDNLVLWAESHDDFQNESKNTTYISQSVINKTWALVAARAKTTALYYVRTTGWRTGNIGDVCTYSWEDPEVVAVNRFHNELSSENEYVSYEGNISYVERGTRGVVLVNASGTNASVNVTAHTMADGTYTDQVTGNTFTVSNDVLSGQIGNTGIAVVYNPETGPTLKATAASRTFADTLDVTIKAREMTTAAYVTSEGDEGEFTGNQTITIGSGSTDNTVITVTLTGTDADGISYEEQFSYYKYDPDLNGGVVPVYFDNSSYGWSAPIRVYLYDGEANNDWPGKEMTQAEAGGDLYYYNVPAPYANGNVIFYSDKTNRYPASGVPGLEIENSPKIFTANYVLEDYVPEHETLVNTSTFSSSEITLDDNAEITLGDSVDITLSCTGGYTDAVQEYTVNIMKDGVDMESASSLTSAYYSYTPQEEGTYQFECIVRDSHNQVSKKTCNVYVPPKANELINTSTIGDQPYEVGCAIPVYLSAEGGEYSNYLYDIYVRYGSGTFEEVETNLWGNNYPYLFTPQQSGDAELKVVVTDYDGDIPYGSAEKTFLFTVNGALLNNSTIVDSAEEEQVSFFVSEEMTIMLKASGGSEPYSYTVTYTYNDGEPITLCENTTESSVNFTPTEAGSYTFTITVTDEAGVSVEKTIDIDVYEKLVNTSTLYGNPTFCFKGDTLTVNFSAEGGTEPYTYQINVEYSDEYGDWVPGEVYVYDDAATINVTHTGSIKISVTVEDDNWLSNEKTFLLDVYLPLKNECSFDSDLTTGTVGEAINVICQASGGAGIYYDDGQGEYEFALSYRTDKTEPYTIATEYGSYYAMSFTPQTYGSYWFRISVKDSNGNTVHLYKYLRVKPRSLTNECEVDKKYVKYNASILIVCDASGGYAQNKEDYQYALYCKNESTGNEYQVICDFNNCDSMSYNGVTENTKLKISVKDKNGTIRNKYVNVGLMLENLSTLDSSYVYFGESMPVNLDARGGNTSEAYQFALSYKTPTTNGYVTVNDYGEWGSTLSFMPETQENYTLKISVRDVKGTVRNVYKTFRVEAPRLVNKSTILNPNLYIVEPYHTDAVCTVYCAAEGGHGGYQYALAVKENGEYVEKVAYSDTDTMTISFSKTGTYVLRITVKDERGTEKHLYPKVTVGKGVEEIIVY